MLIFWLKRLVNNLVSLLISGLFLLVIVFSSCNKEEGPGGVSTITGKVIIREYNSTYTTVLEEYEAMEEDVYLIYGEDTIYSDRFRTNYDGSYWFQYLREGEYTLFAYGKDSTQRSPGGKVPVMVKVYVDGSDKAFIAPVITILDN